MRRAVTPLPSPFQLSYCVLLRSLRPTSFAPRPRQPPGIRPRRQQYHHVHSCGQLPLVSRIAFTQSSQPRMTTAKTNDVLNLLTYIASQAPNSTPALSSFTYDYNSANQRTRVTCAEGSHRICQCDTLRQIPHSMRLSPAGTPRNGRGSVLDIWMRNEIGSFSRHPSLAESPSTAVFRVTLPA